MVSGGILKRSNIIRQCNTDNKSNRYIKEKNYKTTIRRL